MDLLPSSTGYAGTPYPYDWLLIAVTCAALAYAAVLHLRLRFISGDLDYIPSSLRTNLASDRTTPPRGTISLVGAGPGDPDLLTIAAWRALRSADVIISDRIAAPELLALLPKRAVVHVSDKLPGKDADGAQDALNVWGIAALRRGKRVVRLKVGDPFLFGRGGEEVDFYRSHGFDPLVIAGVTSALAAPLAAGIPTTHRGAASSVLIATGQGRHGEFPPLPPFDSARTLILLMAVARLKSLEADLRAVGYPASTPVAIVERATQQDQRVTRGTLGSIAGAAAAAGVASPAVIVVGGVVDALQVPPFAAVVDAALVEETAAAGAAGGGRAAQRD